MGSGPPTDSTALCTVPALSVPVFSKTTLQFTFVSRHKHQSSFFDKQVTIRIHCHGKRETLWETSVCRNKRQELVSIVEQKVRQEGRGALRVRRDCVLFANFISSSFQLLRFAAFTIQLTSHGDLFSASSFAIPYQFSGCVFQPLRVEARVLVCPFLLVKTPPIQ